MKKVFNLAMMLVVITLFSNGLAYAGGKGKKVEISQDVVVNGVEVKKGKYQITFDEEKNEMGIWQGDKLIAKSNARKGLRKDKALSTQILTSKGSKNNLLRGIIMEGQQETILLNNNSGTANAAPQQ
jgi:hypothetical protein